RTIVLNQLRIVTKEGKPIIKSDSIAVAIKPFSLIFGKIRFASLTVYNTRVTLDYDLLQLLRHKQGMKSDTTQNLMPVSYSKLVSALQTKLFDYLPNKMAFRNLDFSYQNDKIQALIRFENFLYNNEKYLGEVLFIDNQSSDRCVVEGSIIPSSGRFICRMSQSQKKLLRLPYIGPRWHASFGFDTLQFDCGFSKEEDSQMYISGDIKVSNLAVFHKQIGPDTVKLPFGEMEFNMKLGPRFVEVDSSSVIRFNRFHFSPYIKFERDTSSKITVAFIKQQFRADDLFKSLPQGLFNNFEGLETTGDLEYQMKLSIDLANPDSVKFYSDLENKGFSIKKYGVTDFRLMNGSFFHEVYENDMLAARFQVGPENPDFVPLNEISPFLRYSVLTSEDGDFFYHKGFNMGAFRESIAKNVKEKRFARGGSTISMQLVKNVFLSRKKTYSRKIEEALIVWLIENQRLTSKDRMFEVYLNIIEWGPGIYGIKPAAWFYFKKQPSELTLTESIYLTSIIPRPKGFRYMFNEDGNLREFISPYYKLLSGIMVRRNQITPEDTVNLRPVIKLKGEAKRFLEKQDSTTMEDSLYFIQPIELAPFGGDEK
ncbi:MAG TPA: biosynthetic peptidoglycan transglycosylase, partial [Bacteroidales bacterium]|nr:biosynthetic peptidoglycan transglycosylase [Bacteroidales bacterium]